MNKFYAYIYIISIFLFISSCKKGENDPSISLRTRKARLVGEWKVVKSEETRMEKVYELDTYNQYTTVYDTTLYDGTTSTQVAWLLEVSEEIQTLSPYTPATRTYSEIYEFNKDGSFTYIKDYSESFKIEEKGTWTFLPENNSKKHKNKEAIQLYTSSHIYYYVDGSITDQFETDWSSNESNSFKVLVLDKLSHKKITAIYEINSHKTSYNNGENEDIKITRYLERQ